MQKITTQIGGKGQKMKIISLGPNSNKYCIHNLWASRSLEMQKLSARCSGGVRGGGFGGECWNSGCVGKTDD